MLRGNVLLFSPDVRSEVAFSFSLVAVSFILILFHSARRSSTKKFSGGRRSNVESAKVSEWKELAEEEVRERKVCERELRQKLRSRTKRLLWFVKNPVIRYSSSNREGHFLRRE